MPRNDVGVRKQTSLLHMARGLAAAAAAAAGGWYTGLTLLVSM